MLRQLKLNNGDISEIKFLSKHLRNMLNQRNDNITFSSEAINHDKYIDRNFWKYVKTVLNKSTAILPSFNKVGYFAFFSTSFSARKPNKCFTIPNWIPKFDDPKGPFNLNLQHISK